MKKNGNTLEINSDLSRSYAYDGKEKYAVSTVANVMVIVYYEKEKYSVKIVIPTRTITGNKYKIKNSMFDLKIHFKDARYSDSDGRLKIFLEGKYKKNKQKKLNECNSVTLKIKESRYKGRVILSPDFYIPEKCDSFVKKIEAFG